MQSKQATKKKDKVFDRMLTLLDQSEKHSNYLFTASTLTPGGVVTRINHLKEGVDRSLEGERFDRKGFEVALENIGDAIESLNLYAKRIDGLKSQAENLSFELRQLKREFNIDYFMEEARRRYLLSEPEEIEED